MSDTNITEKNISARIIHKHDIEKNWNKAYGFIPKKAEIIVYDADESYPYPRFKIGDGTNNIIDLPFVVENIIERFLEANRVNSPKPTTISLLGSNWINTETEGIYTQDITEQLIGKVTVNSKIDLQPTPEQLKMFHEKDVTFTTVNEDGVIYVYAIGIKPIQDYDNIQVTITEVTIYE